MNKNICISVKHSANIGDLIATLAGLKGYYEETGKKFAYYQHLDVNGVYHNNYYHPTQKDGKQVMCNKKMFDMIKPLVMQQEYIKSFEEYNGQKIVVDLDRIRNEVFVNLPYGSIQSWYALAFPDLAFDISRQWIDVPRIPLDEHLTNKILLNFTNRYRNDFIDYFFLKDFQEQLLFTGTKQEHEDFCKKWELNIPLVLVENFLELAQIMQQSKFFIGNQSFCWNLNRALNLPSILEMYYAAPNCTPFVGNHNYGFYHQNALKYYFEKLIKLT